MTKGEHFRAYDRLILDLPATIRTDVNPQDRDANMLNIGLGGVCLEIDEALVPGVGVIVSVKTPRLWDPLSIAGRVVWATWQSQRRTAHVGIQFEFYHHAPSAPAALFQLLGGAGAIPPGR